MPPTQQYPVTSGTASFYPGTSPAEYSAYGKTIVYAMSSTTMLKHKHKFCFSKQEIGQTYI